MARNDSDEIKQTRRKASILADVVSLVQHPGWKIVEQHFKRQIAEYTKALDDAEDFKKIRRLQERKKAFVSMLETVMSLCDEHSATLLELDNMESDKRDRDEYGDES